MVSVRAHAFIAAVLLLHASTIQGCTVQSPNRLYSAFFRLGDGCESSINEANGELRQPWALDPVSNTWYKLTYESYSLGYRARFGGVIYNTSSVQVNYIDTSSASLTLDYPASPAAPVVRLQVGISVLGNTLRKDIQACNVGTQDITDFAYWWGTDDDWIADSDSPLKEIGTFNCSGQILPASSAQAGQGQLLVISAQGTGVVLRASAEGRPIISHYSSPPDGILNVVATDPNNSPLVQEDDGSYGMKMPVALISQGQCASFWISYCGGDIASCAPTCTSTPTPPATATATDTATPRRTPTATPSRTPFPIKVEYSLEALLSSAAANGFPPLGTLPASASCSTTLLLQSTEMAMGCFQIGIDMPVAQQGSGEIYQILDWGTGVTSGMLWLTGANSAASDLGRTLEFPNSASAVGQVITLRRFDSNGNLVTTGSPVTFEVTLGVTSGLSVYRYPDSSTVGREITTEGGLVGPCSTPTDGCYSITSQSTSSFLAFNFTSITESDSEWGWLGFLGLLAVPIAMGIIYLYRRQLRVVESFDSVVTEEEIGCMDNYPYIDNLQVLEYSAPMPYIDNLQVLEYSAPIPTPSRPIIPILEVMEYSSPL